MLVVYNKFGCKDKKNTAVFTPPMLNFVNYTQITLNFLVFAMRRLQKSGRKGRKKAGTRRRGTQLGGQNCRRRYFTIGQPFAVFAQGAVSQQNRKSVDIAPQKHSFYDVISTLLPCNLNAFTGRKH